MHDGGVIPSAKVLAYGNKGNALPQNVANEVDANLTGNDNFFVFLFAHKFFLFDVEVFAGSVYYVVDGDYVACRFGVISQSVVDDVHVVGVASDKCGVTDYAV